MAAGRLGRQEGASPGGLRRGARPAGRGGRRRAGRGARPRSAASGRASATAAGLRRPGASVYSDRPMRIAVLSDIHSNLAALNAVRDDLPSVDEIWVLGDIVGYGPQPNEVIRGLQQLGARSVLGNHDGAAIGTVDPNDFNPDAKTAVEWTATQLDPNARTYLASLPEVRVSGDLTAVHGSPREPVWEYITSPAVAAANL